jgi:hypothetical protein
MGAFLLSLMVILSGACGASAGNKQDDQKKDQKQEEQKKDDQKQDDQKK